MIFNRKKKTNSNLRCPHRHSSLSHPSCYNSDGTLKDYERKSPKILLLDIEVSLMEVYSFWLKTDYIPHNHIKKDWFILSWSAKWLFGSEVMSDVLNSKEALNSDDSRIIKSLYSLLNEADIIISHNGNRYDLPKINSRLLVHGFTPPSHYKTIDTLLVARKVFGFSSNSAEYLNKILNLSLKDDMNFNDWVSCSNGDSEALLKMQRYNKNDIINLEDLYTTIRSWIPNHPNIGLYIETTEPVCTNCGSKNLKWEGFYYTNLGKYQAFRCECGTIGRNKENEIPKEKVILRN